MGKICKYPVMASKLFGLLLEISDSLSKGYIEFPKLWWYVQYRCQTLCPVFLDFSDFGHAVRNLVFLIF
jgi:hypothetical protein